MSKPLRWDMHEKWPPCEICVAQAGAIRRAIHEQARPDAASGIRAETFGPLATKPSNPKDLVGPGKAPLSALPIRVLWRLGLGMLEGACKYGRHNYRAVGVRASIYFDATCRHLFGWWEGEDDDPDSAAKLSHIDKAIVSLMVLRDSMLGGNWVDDRPPRAPVDFNELHAEAQRIIDQHKDKNPRHYTIEDSNA